MGNTPAHAGKTPLWLNNAAGYRKYSRARGKDFDLSEYMENLSEILPRTRERQQESERRGSENGNTPAHAGKTTNN